MEVYGNRSPTYQETVRPRDQLFSIICIVNREKERIRTEASNLIDPETELQFRTSFDGSAKGAAFIAATSLRKSDST